jgi:subtilisin-like proprotein convertase family protein
MSFGATFPANAASLGVIPDTDLSEPTCQNNSSTFKDVTFTVSGLIGTVSNVAVSFSASHSYLQDLEVSLRGPGNVPFHLLFSATGTTSTVVGTCAGSSNDLSTANTYTFSDTAAANWWTTAAANPVPTSTNRTVVSGIDGTTNPPATTSMNAAFAGTLPNGTWTLRFRDRGAGDTGTVTAANLTILTMGDPFGQHIVDFNGDGKTDWTVARDTGGGPSGQVTWFTQYNGPAGGQTDVWGIATDEFTPGDYDGDNKTDVSIWRSGVAGVAAWYTLQSSNGALRFETFGQAGDDSSVIGDYNGDGKDDIAVYRPGANPGDPSFWFWRTAVNGTFFGVQWGQNGDFPGPGDYDGDGKNDFVIQRNGGGGQARFWRLYATGASDTLVFGYPTDIIVPGDYDGDGKTDIALVRTGTPVLNWIVLPSSGGSYTQTPFGDTSTDFLVQGDYDGDGRTDIAVWRSNSGFFYVNRSTGGLQEFDWGQYGDYPPANYNTH